MLEPVIVNANGCGITPALGRDMLVQVERLHPKRETEWIASAAQAIAITFCSHEIRVVAQKKDEKPLPTSELSFPLKMFTGRLLRVDWYGAEDVLMLRDVNSQEELGRIIHLAIPKI